MRGGADRFDRPWQLHLLVVSRDNERQHNIAVEARGDMRKVPRLRINDKSGKRCSGACIKRRAKLNRRLAQAPLQPHGEGAVSVRVENTVRAALR